MAYFLKPDGRVRAGIALALVLAIGLGTLQLLKSRSRSAPEMHGVVVEVVNPQAAPKEWKFRPLENADIKVVWWGGRNADSPTLHSGGRCLRYLFAKSGRDGTYVIPGWTTEQGSSVGYSAAYAFLPGYITVVNSTGEDPLPTNVRHILRRVGPGEHETAPEEKIGTDHACDMGW